MKHNALILLMDADGEWEVWCRPCGYSRVTRSQPLARILQRQHNADADAAGDAQKPQ